MPKPIILIQVPKTTPKSDFYHHQEYLEKKLFDYHVLIVNNTTDSIEISMFKTKDFSNSAFKKITKIIKKIIIP